MSNAEGVQFLEFIRLNAPYLGLMAGPGHPDPSVSRLTKRISIKHFQVKLYKVVRIPDRLSASRDALFSVI